MKGQKMSKICFCGPCLYYLVCGASLKFGQLCNIQDNIFHLSGKGHGSRDTMETNFATHVEEASQKFKFSIFNWTPPPKKKKKEREREGERR